MRKKTRMVMLGVLCGGLLLIGIGIGVFGLEFSQLSYGGTRVPEGEPIQTVETFRVAEGDAPIWIESGMWYPRWNLETLTTIKENNDLAPGMVQIAVTYRKIPGMELWISGSGTQANTYITLSYSQSSPMAALLAYKDWLLQDLQNQKWCEYAPLDIEAVEITVNPADRDRVQWLSSNMQWVVDETNVGLEPSSSQALSPVDVNELNPEVSDF